MNKGKLVASAILLAGAVAGGLLWWTENYAYYEPASSDAETITATTFDGVLDPLPIADFEGIDAETSPLRFRACFSTPLSLAMMTETYRPYEGATPLNTPGWFDCYDAGALSREMDSGRAIAFLGEENYIYGFDRVVLVTQDGHGYAWHQINHCGEAVFGGDPAPADCPPAPETN